MKLIYIAVTIAGIALFGGAALADDDKAPEKKPTAAKLVTPDEAEKLIAGKKVVIIDVRTPDEFAAGHIAGAKNINLNGRDFQEKIEKLDKDQAYLVHCAVGMRSARACKKMSELQFKTLYDLKGGINAWKKEGKQVTKEPAK